MPLPPALAARLAKRGIVVPKHEQSKQAPPAEQVEEVFAEDYDEPDTNHSSYHGQNKHEAMETEQEQEMLIHEALACPNKANKYHECTDYCKERWGFKRFEPDAKLEKKRIHMLKKHPLPENWEEVGDPETGRYYYWNTVTDEVSWLPPSHPRTQITLPAERLKELFESAKEQEGGSEEEDEGDIMDIDDFEEIERKILMEKSVKEKEKKREKKKKEEPLDPMDPAAYSDIPRGTWSTGLDTKGQAKTGVDATASGPLYQQRPYPSPGAILRMNQQLDD